MPTKDLEKARRYRREWYARNKKRAKSAVLSRKKRIGELVKEAKSGKSCVRCGESRVACLDFHHVDPSTKRFALATARNVGLSLETILEEIKKCIVLCANCHRVEHDGAFANR